MTRRALADQRPLRSITHRPPRVHGVLLVPFLGSARGIAIASQTRRQDRLTMRGAWRKRCGRVSDVRACFQCDAATDVIDRDLRCVEPDDLRVDRIAALATDLSGIREALGRPIVGVLGYSLLNRTRRAGEDERGEDAASAGSHGSRTTRQRNARINPVRGTDRPSGPRRSRARRRRARALRRSPPPRAPRPGRGRASSWRDA